MVEGLAEPLKSEIKAEIEVLSPDNLISREGATVERSRSRPQRSSERGCGARLQGIGGGGRAVEAGGDGRGARRVWGLFVSCWPALGTSRRSSHR